MPKPLLEVEDLKVEFPTRRGVLTAVDGLSLTIGEGEVLGVVGESGAGKSLTGSAIIGLLEPPGRIAGGEIRFDGRRIDNLPPEEMRKIRGRQIGAMEVPGHVRPARVPLEAGRAHPAHPQAVRLRPSRRTPPGCASGERASGDRPTDTTTVIGPKRR